VDDVDPDDSTTLVRVLITLKKDAYSLEASSIEVGATINSVTVYFRFNSNFPGSTAYGQPGLRLDTNEITGTEIAGSTTWTTYSEALSRPGGGKWSVSDLADLQLVIGLRASSELSLCTQVYVEVDYTLNIAPTWQDMAESDSDPATYSYSPNYGFQINCTDDTGMNNAFFTHNNSGSWANITCSNDTSDIFYANITSMAVGVLNYSFVCNDTSGNQNRSDYATFTVSQSTPTCNLYLNGTDGDESYNTYNVLNATFNIDNSQGTVYIDSNTTGWTVENTTYIFISTGVFNFTGFYDATQNYTACSETHYATVTVITYNKSISDSITFGGSFPRELLSKKEQADSITWSDSFSRLFSRFKQQSDSLTFSDMVERIGLFERDLSDYISYGELQELLSEFEKQQLDSITYGELLEILGLFDRSNSDSVTWYETLERLGVFDRSLDDTITYSEVLEILTEMQRSLGDTFTWSDVIQVFLTAERVQSDSLTFTGKVSLASIYTRHILESMVYNELTTIQFTMRYLEEIIDTFTITGAISKVSTIFRTNSETISFNDIIKRSTTFMRIISDIFSFFTDIFKNRITQTTTTTTISSSSGGGGGGAIYTNEGVDIEANDSTTITIEKSDVVGITEILIYVKDDVSNVKITIQKYTDKPSNVVENVLGAVHSYIEITSYNLNDSNIESAKVKFKVQKLWLGQNKLDPDTVLLNRYSDNRWKELETTMTTQNNTYYYYEATTPGLSYFVITAKEVKAIVCGNGVCEIGESYEDCSADCPKPSEAPVCGNGVCESGENCGNCLQDCSCAEEYICQDNACIPEQKEKKFPLKLVIISILISVTLPIIILLVHSLKKEGKQKEKKIFES